MGISNFPAALQPIIQTGFLDREFQQAMNSRLGYRACADREEFAVGIGETLTKTRAGLKPSVTTPIQASLNTNLDNGLTPVGWGVEQFTVTINHYAATTDLNIITSRVGIASQFLQNAYVNGEQAARSLDELARNALFAPYFGGNTRVRTTLTSAGPQVCGGRRARSSERVRQRRADGRQLQQRSGCDDRQQHLHGDRRRGGRGERVDHAVRDLGRADAVGQFDDGGRDGPATPCRRPPRR